MRSMWFSWCRRMNRLRWTWWRTGRWSIIIQSCLHFKCLFIVISHPSHHFRLLNLAWRVAPSVALKRGNKVIAISFTSVIRKWNTHVPVLVIEEPLGLHRSRAQVGAAIRLEPTRALIVTPLHTKESAISAHIVYPITPMCVHVIKVSWYWPHTCRTVRPFITF